MKRFLHVFSPSKMLFASFFVFSYLLQTTPSASAAGEALPSLAELADKHLFLPINPQFALILLAYSILMLALLLLSLDRRQSKKLLLDFQERDQFMTHLMDRLPGGVGILETDETSILPMFLNEGFLKMLHLTTPSVYTPEMVQRGVHPEDWSELMQSMRLAIAQKQPMAHTLRILCSKTEYRWVNIRANYVEQRGEKHIFYAFFTDIDDMKRTQDQLELSRHTISISIEQTGLVFWTYDIAARRIAFQNQSRNIFDDPQLLENFPESVRDSDSIHPEDKAHFMRLFERVQAGEKSSTGVIRLRKPHTEQYWHAKIVSTAVCNDANEPIKIIGSALDITSLVEAKNRYRAKLHSITALYADVVSVVHVNLTQNTCIEGFSPFFGALPRTAQSLFEMLYLRLCSLSEHSKFCSLFNRESLIAQYALGNITVSMDCRFRFDDTSAKWLSVCATITKNPNTGDAEAILRFTDIDDKMTIETLLHTVVGNDYDFILLIDCTDSSLRIFNGKESSLSSTTSETPYSSHFFSPENLERHVRRHYVGGDSEEFLQKITLPAVLAQLRTESPYCLTYSVRDLTGAIRRKKLSYSYMEHSNSLICCTCHDITDIYEAEQSKNRMLQHALDVAIHANAAKSDFLSRMSHEIRTPMNAILGMSYLGLQESTDTVAHCYLSKVHDSAEYLLGLINDILDMSKIESQKIELHPDPYAMASLEDTLNTIIRPQCEHKGVSLVYDTDDVAEKTVLLDKLRFHQIFLNLLSNAMKFTEKGGQIELHMEQIAEKEPIITVRFTVRDTGIGMSEAFLPHLFEPFAQEHSDKTSHYNGTGLGLAIVHNLVSLMDGTIAVESALGHGTTFRVVLNLPLAQPHITCVRPSEPPQLAYAYDFTGHRLLLAEDHPLNAEIAMKLLKSVGFEIDRAKNGASALELFQNSPPQYYSVILMDIRMPQMDGLTATREIRASVHADAHAIPIIAMTANAFDQDICDAMAAGMDGHLAKPINPPLLYKTLSTYIS